MIVHRSLQNVKNYTADKISVHETDGLVAFTLRYLWPSASCKTNGATDRQEGFSYSCQNHGHHGQRYAFRREHLFLLRIGRTPRNFGEQRFYRRRREPEK